LSNQQRAVEAGFHLQERQQAVSDEGDVDLVFQSLAAGAVKMFDREVLLDPLKKYFYLPAIAVDVPDLFGASCKVVGEDQDLVAFGVPGLDQAQVVLHLFLALAEEDDLVTVDDAFRIDRMICDHVDDGVALEAGDEQDALFRVFVELLVIDVTPVKDVQGACLVDHQLVHLGPVGPLGRGDHHLVRDAAIARELKAQMGLDARLGFTKLCPGVLGQAEADGGGVDQVDVAELFVDVVKTVFQTEMGDQALEQHLHDLCAKNSQPAGDAGCMDGIEFDLGFQVLVVETVADIPQGRFLVHLGAYHQFDQLHRAHLLHVPVGVHRFESLVKLRKSRKDLLECGLFGTLVHMGLPYFRDYGQGLPHLYYKGIFSFYQGIYSIIFIFLHLSWYIIT